MTNPDPRLAPGNYRRIARTIEMAPQHVSRFLRGKAGSKWETACAIADAAGVSMDDLRRHVTEARKQEEAAAKKAARKKVA